MKRNEIFRFVSQSTNSQDRLVLCEIILFRFAKCQLPGPISTLRNDFVSQSTNSRDPISTLRNNFVSQSANSQGRLVLCEIISFRKVPTPGILSVLCEITGFNTRDFIPLNKTILTSAVVHCLVLK